MTTWHCSNDTQEADILDRCGLHLKGFNTAVYGNIVRCSLKSFEQCINSESNKSNIVYVFVISIFAAWKV